MLFEKEKSYFWMALSEKHADMCLYLTRSMASRPLVLPWGMIYQGSKFVNTPNLLILYVVFVLLKQYFYTNSRMLEQTELFDPV